jgi:cytoskeletal protein RodZ
MATVGETLAAERRRQGKSLADVSENTKIRSRLLDCLEQGLYDKLPSPTYVKGYIQSYAHYLQIPAEPLVEQYRSESAGHASAGSPADRYLSAIPAQTLVPSRDAQHAIPRNIWILMAVVLLVVILGLCGLTRLFSAPSPTTTTPPTPSAVTTTGSPGASATVATPSVQTTSTTAAGSFTLRITIRQGMASWVKATIDGTLANDGTLLGGDSREYQVGTDAVLVIGQPGAVLVTRDGNPVHVPSTPNAQFRIDATK